ncbi:aconitase/3-isopropylmalate dehydratase large subunit family protein [Streptomyces sp. NBC_00233]|uniref:3-isopropylmalate dehydratase large subunit n=1 Tax=Streptomyces sp. NBC_00233 TaxID=2975686 RepID=UPI00225A23EE|nr:aconitase/3-isopropylmalate dehydratase large subunit family protein [Streptomyces sp. NBC_00233]MCX5233511.1 aconitase/3-isopropylmalate dehydratase large subunit family protein [Streptomyces sp. NBC_00233]
MSSPGRTISDKIIDAHAVDMDSTALYREVRIDALLGHDATIALLVDEFERRGLEIWDRDKVIFTNDHFSPPATIERADISNKFLRFARQRNITHLMLDRGICHQLLVESHLCAPGSLIVGADSHTIMAGGVGACATGMGSTDILYALATGRTWMRRPATIRVRFHGALADHCSGRDIVLELLRMLGEAGAQYRCLEFHDLADQPLKQDDRFAISNMAVELGAKFGVFVPDSVTAQYCTTRDGHEPAPLVLPDPDAYYEQTVDINLSTLTPRIAKPWSPGNVIDVREIEDMPLSVAFLGSCSSGRLNDIRDAAEEVEGKAIHPGVRFVVIPASVEVFKQALDAGYVTTLTNAGAIFDHSSCGPCGGIDKGVLGGDDVCISTSNRNFRGRMGHWESRTYLASARTVSRAALAGRIHPGLYQCDDGNLGS